VSHDEEIRQVLRGLGRRNRPPPPKVLHHQARRTRPSNTHANGSRSKKSTRLGTVPALAAAWAEASTHANERTIARELAAHAGDIQARELTPLHAQALNTAWQKRGLAPWSRWHNLQALKRLYTYIERVAAMPRDALRSTVPTMVRPDPREKIFTQEQIAATLEAVPAWMKLVILAAYELGLRSGAIAELAPHHYDAPNQRVIIRGKGDKVHVLPVSPRLAELLSAAEPDSPVTPYWLALRGVMRSPMNTKAARHDALERGWRLWRDRLKLGDLRLHDLRRTLACRIATETGDLFNAQAALGHKHTSTTLTYLAPLTKDMKKLEAAVRAAWVPKGGTVH